MGNVYTIGDYLKKDDVLDRYISSVPQGFKNDLLNILQKPILTGLSNKKLRQVSSQIKITQNNLIYIQKTFGNIIDFLSYFALIGANPLGFSLPQIGIKKRMIIISFKPDMFKHIFGPLDLNSCTKYTCMINPKILQVIDHHDTKENRESCLSLPGLAGMVNRYQSLKISFWDTNGKENIYEIYGYNAIVFQHEIDHLNGILYPDRASTLFAVDYSTKTETQITYQDLINKDS